MLDRVREVVKLRELEQEASAGCLMRMEDRRLSRSIRRSFVADTWSNSRANMKGNAIPRDNTFQVTIATSLSKSWIQVATTSGELPGRDCLHELSGL